MTGKPESFSVLPVRLLLVLMLVGAFRVFGFSLPLVNLDVLWSRISTRFAQWPGGLPDIVETWLLICIAIQSHFQILRLFLVIATMIGIVFWTLHKGGTLRSSSHHV